MPSPRGHYRRRLRLESLKPGPQRARHRACIPPGYLRLAVHEPVQYARHPRADSTVRLTDRANATATTGGEDQPQVSSPPRTLPAPSRRDTRRLACARISSQKRRYYALLRGAAPHLFACDDLSFTFADPKEATIVWPAAKGTSVAAGHEERVSGWPTLSGLIGEGSARGGTRGRPGKRLRTKEEEEEVVEEEEEEVVQPR
ncbi:hypothetical protein KM043_017416 [Ampulex compressa]|nr:hypothetical protein KM043_017416 [Ampulex compressa]